MATGDVKYGPYGHSGEPNWSVVLDSRTSLKEVIIYHGYIVDGIGFVIADHTGKTTIKSSGGYGGNQSKITLKEDEYITQLSGLHGQYYSSPTIGSLTIHTNLRPDGYGPYGQAKNITDGIRFSTPILSNDGWIVEFFGRHGPLYLQSIGVSVRKGDVTENVKDVKYGPYGHSGEPNWSVVLDSRTSVKEVIINYGYIVDGIGFVIADRTGKTTTISSGGYGGGQSKITLKEDEYITQLSGLHGQYFSSPTIGSLTIHTNLRPDGYGPYGQAKNLTHGTKISSPVLSDDGWIVEFFGRHGSPYLQSIGVTVRKGDETEIENPQEDVMYGPYGHWADPNWSVVLDSRTSLKEVIIYHGQIVDGIGFVIVDRNGKTTTKSSSGGYHGNQSKITLKEDEYIIQLSGIYGQYNSKPTIGSLTIHTNLFPGGYGPYGQAKNLTNDTRFSSSPALSDGDWIVEFFGRHGAPYLQSIGFSVRKA